MRNIKKITVVNNQGANSYEVGNIINGLQIKHIKDCSLEYEDSITIAYRCLCNDNDSIVEFWGVPVVVEYEEAEV